MNDTTISLIIMGTVLISGVSLVLYSQGYFDIITPEPKIALTQVTFTANNNRCDVDFTIENTGRADGYAVVELRTGPAKNLIEQNRYFIKSDTIEEKKILTSDIPMAYCNDQQNTISITRTERE